MPQGFSAQGRSSGLEPRPQALVPIQRAGRGCSGGSLCPESCCWPWGGGSRRTWGRRGEVLGVGPAHVRASIPESGPRVSLHFPSLAPWLCRDPPGRFPGGRAARRKVSPWMQTRNSAVTGPTGRPPAGSPPGPATWGQLSSRRVHAGLSARADPVFTCTAASHRASGEDGCEDPDGESPSWQAEGPTLNKSDGQWQGRPPGADQ